MPDWWLIGIGLLAGVTVVAWWRGWLRPQAAVGALVALVGAGAALVLRGRQERAQAKPGPSVVPPEPPGVDEVARVALAVIEEEAEREIERTTGLVEDGDLGAEFNRRRP